MLKQRWVVNPILSKYLWPPYGANPVYQHPRLGSVSIAVCLPAAFIMGPTAVKALLQKEAQVDAKTKVCSKPNYLKIYLTPHGANPVYQHPRLGRVGTAVCLPAAFTRGLTQQWRHCYKKGPKVDARTNVGTVFAKIVRHCCKHWPYWL